MKLEKIIVIIDRKLTADKELLENTLPAKASGWRVVCEPDYSDEQIPSNALLVFLHRSQFKSRWEPTKSRFLTTEVYATGTGGTKEVPKALGTVRDYLDLNWLEAMSRWRQDLDNWDGGPIPRFPISILVKTKGESISLFEHLAAFDILVQGYLAAIYLAKGALAIKGVEQVFEALKTNKGLRSREELSKEASEGELAPFRLFRSLCMKAGDVCDNSKGNASPKPFQDLAEGYFWFDSVLYEVCSDCPETLSGDPSFFTSTTDAEVQDLANFLGPGAEAYILKAILEPNESLIAAGKLCQNLCSGDQQVYSGRVTGGAIRTIWELIRSGLNNEVARYHTSVSGDATEIIERLGPFFFGKSSGAGNREDVIEALFSLAFLEFRKAHELVTKAAARKKKIKKFRELRTRLNHSCLKNDFLSIFGPFRSPPYDVDGMSEELLGLDCEQGKHRDAIDSWNERIKPELVEFFTGDSFDSNIKPNESFGILAEDCREWIKALGRFVEDVWPGFFQLEINARKKKAKSFFAAGINLYQAIRSLRVELDFFKYFSVRD